MGLWPMDSWWLWYADSWLVILLRISWDMCAVSQLTGRILLYSLMWTDCRSVISTCSLIDNQTMLGKFTSIASTMLCQLSTILCACFTKYCLAHQSLKCVLNGSEVVSQHAWEYQRWTPASAWHKHKYHPFPDLLLMLSRFWAQLLPSSHILRTDLWRHVSLVALHYSVTLANDANATFKLYEDISSQVWYTKLLYCTASSYISLAGQRMWHRRLDISIVSFERRIYNI